MISRFFPVRGILTFLLLAVVWSPAVALDMGKMTGVVWGSGTKNLVVILHGDGGPGRYDAYADRLARQNPNTTVVTLTRPAFRYKGQYSPGQNPSKDHYTKRNNQSVAASLAAMKKSLGNPRLIAVGHSGGSGQLGTIIGAYPGIVDVAILAACPCDVPRWRMHRRGKNNWTRSQSPHKFAAKIPTTTTTYAITMRRDSNTLVRFAEKYVAVAQKAGVKVQLVVPSGGSHSWQSYQPHVDKLIRNHLR